jgi:pyruvate dehydrogenase E2 component (dihydrolipoamide acetyltransferase)
MATEIKMPQLSDTMDKGTILKWFKKEGDKVSRGDALAEVATDKADLEVESFFEGVLLKVYANVGDDVKVGELLAVVGAAGEAVGSSAPASQVVTPVAAPAPQAVSAPVAAPVSTPAPQTAYVNGSADRTKISPLAKNIAQSHGVDYTNLSGSGEGGRIVRKDVEKVISGGVSEAKPQEVRTPVSTPVAPSTPAPSASSAPTITSAGMKIEVLSKMRATIASRMVESVNTAPHFYATTKVDVSNLLHLREVLKANADYQGITFNHLIIKAAGLSLRKYPRINSKYDNGSLVEPGDVNIGIITALPDGLLIPVVKSADQLSVGDIVREAKGLVDRARSGKPKADDLQSGTFSISNIGKADVEHFTAIINPGQGAILAVSGIQEEPVVKNGQVVPGKTMRLTLSVDHRIIDGVVAGEFLTYLKSVLEEPVLLFA